MTKKLFTYSAAKFQEMVQNTLQKATTLGATDAAVDVSEGHGLSVTVRRGEVETIEQSVDKSLGVSIYLGQRRGNASTSDFSEESVTRTVQAAYDIARYTAPDPCAGLASEDLLEKIRWIWTCFILGQSLLQGPLKLLSAQKPVLLR